MSEHYSDSGVTLHHGDCLDVLAQLPDASVDAVVCDPPYGLANTDPTHVAETITRWVNGERDYLPGGAGFMGKAWDAFVPPVAVWDDCLRVLKPGGHVLAFAGSRTVDLMTLGLRLAGFDIRDSIAWLYGSGFPKSLDVSKAIDRLRVEDREPMLRVRAWLNAQRIERGFSLGQINALFGLATNGGGNASNWTQHPTNIEIPSWDKWVTLKRELDLPDDMDAEVWRLNGRKGKPGDNFEAREVTGQHEHGNPIGTYEHRLGAGNGRTAKERRDNAATDAARTWQGWGTALKPAFEPIVVARKPLSGTVAQTVLAHGTGALNIDSCRVDGGERTLIERADHPTERTAWNAAEDGSMMFGSRNAGTTSQGRWPANVVLDGPMSEVLDEQSGERIGSRTASPGNESGEPSQSGAPFVGGRITSTYDDQGGASRFFYVAKADASERVRVNGTAHPTVKPLALMRWLVRLVTPPGGTVLEPFAGSGTTVEACILEGFRCVAIEREADYLPLIVQRINRRRDPVQAVKGAGEDGGLFDLLGDGAA